MQLFFRGVEKGNSCRNLFSRACALYPDRIKQNFCGREASFQNIAHIFNDRSSRRGDEADDLRDSRNGSFPFSTEIARFGKFLKKFGIS